MILLAAGPAWAAEPWRAEAFVAAGGVGFAPTASGVSVELGLARPLGAGPVAFALGPYVGLDTTQTFGPSLSAGAAARVVAAPWAALALDAGLSLGGRLTLAAAGPQWRMVDGEPVPAGGPPGPPGGRASLWLGAGWRLPGRAAVTPHLRYEQAVWLPFATAAGVPLLAHARVGVGVGVTLGEPR